MTSPIKGQTYLRPINLLHLELSQGFRPFKFQVYKMPSRQVASITSKVSKSSSVVATKKHV